MFQGFEEKKREHIIVCEPFVFEPKGLASQPQPHLDHLFIILQPLRLRVARRIR